MNNFDPQKRYKNETGLYNYSNRIEQSLKSYLFENMSEDKISMYFPPKFEFLKSVLLWFFPSKCF